MPTLRPGQQILLEYTHGSMGVAAVPGSGKTWTLSLLAAEIIAGDRLGDEQEVLVVTLVNSAVNNFARRVSAFLKERDLLPLGFRVRTLHGLAHDLVRERPALVGLADDFQIIDEREADFVRDEAAQAWLQGNPYALDDLLAPDLDEGKREWVRRDPLPELVKSVALSFIRAAKDAQATPDTLRERARGLPLPLPLAEMGAAIYADYQRALAYRGAVDF
ncbi:MAG: ATP-dependent helicase, partial [Chloroflexi bacterium]|nr:ATP-dependent helicase [Chloroflexota bacterium]